MQLRIYFLFVTFFSTEIINAQTLTSGTGPDLVWEKYFGYNYTEAKDILLTTDGGSMVVGTSEQFQQPVKAWVAKLDAAGNVQWQRFIGGSGNDEFNSVISTSDKGYLCMGKSNSSNGDLPGNFGNYDGWVVKLSHEGNIQWSRNYGDANYNEVYSGTELSDSSFAIIGSNAMGFEEIVWKLTNSGIVTWQKFYLTNYKNSYNIIETDNHQLLTSRGLLFDPATGDTTRLPWDLSNKFVSSLKKYNNKIYISTGEDSNGISVSKVGYLENLYSDFSYQTWHYTYPGSDNDSYAFSPAMNGLAPLPGNSFALAGAYTHYSRGGINQQAFFYSGGNIRYFFDNSPDAPDNFTAVAAFPNGDDFLCAGTTAANITNGGWVVKLSSINNITGTVFLDLNNNNIKDAGEPGLNNFVIKSSRPGNDFSTSTLNVVFNNRVDTGVFNTSALITDYPYYAVTPISKTSTFTTFNDSDTINFAVHKIADAIDYTASLFSTTPARPGLAVTYKIAYSNKGTDTGFNKKIRFIKDRHLQLNRAEPAFQTISGDTLTWEINNFLPGNDSIISIEMNVAGMPVLNVGDKIRSSVLIDSTEDLTPGNNFSMLQQSINTAFQPNDKQEVHDGYITPYDVLAGNELTYTIRFQNTRKDTAFSILVRDTLDDKIDKASFQMLSFSHPFQLKIIQGKYITWEFNQVKLPGSSQNEMQSQGYISYKVKPKNNLAVGDSIFNRAAVYFDFDPLIQTNTQLTVVKELVVTWTGAKDITWEEPLNWSTGQLPDKDTKVIIPANVPHFPVLNSNAIIYSLTVDPAASVTVNGSYTLEVKGKD